MRNIVFIILLLTQYATAQDTFKILGHFPNFPNSTYELKGYEGMQQKTLSTAASKEEGKFYCVFIENGILIWPISKFFLFIVKIYQKFSKIISCIIK